MKFNIANPTTGSQKKLETDDDLKPTHKFVNHVTHCEMSLLEIITKASSAISTAPDQESSYPIVLNPDPVIACLKPKSHELGTENPVREVTGWDISQTDSTLIELSQKFFKSLTRKLKNTSTFAKTEFLEILTSYLEKLGDRVGISAGVDKLDEGYTSNLIEKLGFFVGRDGKRLIMEACIGLEAWDVLQILIGNGIVEHSCTSNLVHSLIEKRRSDLIVLCVMQLMDLQTYDLMCILKYFLLPPSDGYKSLATVREAWESEALLAIEKASGKGVSGKERILAKEAAILVMMAHDGFSVSELCLHYLLASRNHDEVIFSACVGKLNGEEIKALIKYLDKWLIKYERFPQASPCPKASSVLGLTVCDWIPTLEDVVKCLCIVVDEHFSSLVLHTEFHEELRELEGIIGSLAVEVRLCGTLANLAERLKTELNDRCT